MTNISNWSCPGDKGETITSLSNIESECLIEVTDYLSSLSPSSSKNANIIDDRSDLFQIENVERMKSAQQYVLLLTLKQHQHHSDVDDNNINNNNKNIQDDKHQCNNDRLQFFKRAIQNGNNKIILRIWKNGARWWNLNLKQMFFSNENSINETATDEYDDDDAANNNNDDSSILCHNLAKAEVAGYRVAKRAFDYYNEKRKNGITIANSEYLTKNQWTETNVCIPDVIYFSEPKDNKTSSISGLTSTSTKHPWGLFSYVGEGSNHILNNSMDENGTENETEKQWVACEDFIRDMVKIRHEFGFDEPHPRHGRVNTNQALEYAFHVLDTVILPLHTAFYDEYYNNTTSNATGLHIMTSNENTLLQKDGLDIGWNNYISSSKYDNINSNINPSTSKTAIRPCRYNDMIELYQVIVSYLKKAVTSKMPTSTNTSSKINHDIKMEELMNVLDKCVQTLQYETLETNREENDGLPPVLCHMDLQPQNMILCREENKQCSLELSGEIPHIFSVLDWEESCYADPRFELLLLCRKVVANRDQANILWEHYAMVMLDRFGKMMNRNESQTKTSVLGSIEPWLKLETVHSLITLSMQGLNLGGRNSWEGQSELWNKILREVKRLVDLGWNFCNRILDC